MIALFLLLPLSQQKWSDLPHDLASAEIPQTHFSVVPQRRTKGNEAASIYLKYGMKIIASSCSARKRRSSPPAQHRLRCLHAYLLHCRQLFWVSALNYLFMPLFIYLEKGRVGGGRGGGGGGLCNCSLHCVPTLLLFGTLFPIPITCAN